MRKHVHSRGRGRCRLGSWLILFASLALSAPALAQDGQGSGTAGNAAPEARRPALPPTDPAVVRAQIEDELPELPNMPGELPPVIEPPGEDGPPVMVPDLSEPRGDRSPTRLLPLPGPDDQPAPPLRPDQTPTQLPPAIVAPIMPGTQRVTRIYPRNGGTNYEIRFLPKTPEGAETVVIRGGVYILTNSPQMGTIDMEADSAIIWRRPDPKKGGMGFGPNGENVEDAGQPMEVYLEGNVVVRQDERKVAGNGDQKTYRASRAYYDFVSDRLIALEAQVDVFAPGLTAPMKMTAPRIDQFRALERLANGEYTYGLPKIQADKTLMTGSRFPVPGYRFSSRSTDLTKVVKPQTDPNSGRPVGDPRDPNAPQDSSWLIDARQNIFFMGPVPVFYWPRFAGDVDDLEPPLRAFAFRTNNYFGQSLLLDFNGFKVTGIQKLPWVDLWNIDIDYMSARTKGLPALGTEIGWFGTDILRDLADPYRRDKTPSDTETRGYFGYFDIWGLQDSGRDVLGPGPAIVTNNIAAGKAGYQRTSVPAFQSDRGRITSRHMQSLLTDDDDPLEDWRFQTELGYATDRNFIEEYYKRLFDTGLDQETLGYMIRQRDNWAVSVLGEVNLQPWFTESQWLPKLDYYRLGDSLWGDRLTYFTHSGVDYANTHTAVEVNNPHIFAFMPYDPISNTSGTLSAGRAYSNHEIDMPFQYETFRFMPYVQGQAVGWTNQIDNSAVGRVWGAFGARAELMAWKKYPSVTSELFNVHGLMHKINFEADFRSGYSNVKLNQIGVQDDLDDNTYEYARRYFALTNYAGGLLPAQYDPRNLILRRVLSPITGPTDIQATLETLQLNLHQRLQTKRGPEGKRRIIDYMTFDLSSTYFPNSARDNFGKSFGQNMYNWQWFIGDRTSIISTGWFEFFDISGQPLYKPNVSLHNNPFGLNVITSGVSITRPPRLSCFIGYTVINTGPINTAALNTSVNYWFSPKWYGTYSNMYDFGNNILLASMFSFTRIGADYLVSVGLNVDPQRQSYQFSFVITPRISPSVKMGSGTAGQFDTRFAPTQ